MFGIAICSNPCPPQIIPLYPPLVKGEVGKFVNGASLPSPTRGEGNGLAIIKTKKAFLPEQIRKKRLRLFNKKISVKGYI